MSRRFVVLSHFSSTGFSFAGRARSRNGFTCSSHPRRVTPISIGAHLRGRGRAVFIGSLLKDRHNSTAICDVRASGRDPRPGARHGPARSRRLIDTSAPCGNTWKKHTPTPDPAATTHTLAPALTANARTPSTKTITCISFLSVTKKKTFDSTTSYYFILNFLKGETMSNCFSIFFHVFVKTCMTF